MRRFLREPPLRFLVLGAALFAVAHAMDRGEGGVEASREIRLTLDDLSQLGLSFESQWRRPPTPEELGRLVENGIQEEVLYREALALGLDKDDTIVRRRMVQKMEFLVEDVAAAHEPTTDERIGASARQLHRLSIRAPTALSRAPRAAPSPRSGRVCRSLL